MRKITKHRPHHINQTENPYFLTGRTYFGLPYFDKKEKKEALLRAIKLAGKNYHLALDGWIILDNHYHLLFRPPGCTWEVGIADKSATSRRIANKFATSRSTAPNEVALLSAIKSATSTNKEEVATSVAIENFHIGKVVGTIHGKSSSLLKKSEKSDSSYADWWKAKYWVQIKTQNIKLYGKRSQLAEEKQSQKFRELLDYGTPRQLADFVRKNSKVWYQYTDHIIRDEKDYWMHLNYLHQNSVKHSYTKKMFEYEFSSLPLWVKIKGEKWILDCFERYLVRDFEPEIKDFD